MIKIKKENKENGEVVISLTFQTLKIKENFSRPVSIVFSAFQSTRKYFYFKFKLFRAIFKILAADPQTISLKEGSNDNLLLVSWKNEAKTPVKNEFFDEARKTIASCWKNLIKNIVQKTRNKKKKLAEGITSIIIIIALIFPNPFSLIVPIKASDDLCPVNVDAVLAIDGSKSMEVGESPSKCEWGEIKQVPNEGYATWFLNIKYNVSYEWCMGIRDRFDESSPFYQYKAPTYTSAKNSKITDVKNAANSFIDNLSKSDQSALVSFKNTGNLDKSLSNDHETIETAVNNLTTSGYTNIGDALLAAKSELDTGRPAAQTNKAIILFSDGKANKPNDGHGSDSNENLEDINYAQEAAQQIALAGYKIYTLGFGGDVNASMLQNIAATAGGKYYFEPSENQLSSIYQEISQIPCGSISGCKYLDSDADGDIAGEKTISGWEIILSGDAAAAQLTDESGCYRFNGLSAGNYDVSEGENVGKKPFLQTYPKSQNYLINLNKGEKRQDVDFGNADSSLCQLTDKPGACVKNGFREHQFIYNYNYCGENHHQNIADESCDCQAIELSRQCVGDGQAEIAYNYNFAYCGENFTQTKEDLSCASQYQCGEWENLECKNDGIRNQKRICRDQYQNFYEEKRQISDEICDCAFQQMSKACASDGFANVTYSPNFAYCGDNFSQPEEDLICACVYSEWQNDKCAGAGLRKQTRTQTSQFDYCANLEQNIKDSACAIQTNKCGNDVLEENEQCDDGNVLDNDGCSSACQTEEEEPLTATSTALISGCKYNDANNNSQIEENEEKLGGWLIILEKQAGDEWAQAAATTTQLSENFGCYSFAGLEPGNYRLKESLENQTGWSQTYPQNPPYWQIALAEGQTLSEIDFANYSAVCGNNILDQGEDCDDGNGQNDDGCSASCQIEEMASESPNGTSPATTGGGGPIGSLAISNLSRSKIEKGADAFSSVTISWLTNKPATSRVVYDTVSHSSPGLAPNYGYQWSTPLYDENPKVTFHQVVVSGLNPGTSYYFRPISHGSPEVLGAELEYKIPGEPPETKAAENKEMGGEEKISIPEQETEENQGPTQTKKTVTAQPKIKALKQSPSPSKNEAEILKNSSASEALRSDEEKAEMGAMPQAEFNTGFLAGAVLPVLKFITKPIFWFLLLIASVALYFPLRKRLPQKDG